MKTSIFVGSILLLGTLACTNETTKEGEKSLQDELTETLKKTVQSAEEFKGKLDELLTLPMAAQVSGLSEASAKKDYTKFSSFESLKYEWPSDRIKKVTIGSTSMEVPIDNTIELSWVKNTTLEQFKRDHHNPTQEEIKNGQAAAQRKIDEMETSGQVNKQQGEVAVKELKTATSNFKVTEVPNVGEYAVFVNTNVMGAASRDLKVYYKGLSFTIKADLSDDEATNDKKSIETAKKIISEKLN